MFISTSCIPYEVIDYQNINILPVKCFAESFHNIVFAKFSPFTAYFVFGLFSSAYINDLRTIVIPPMMSVTVSLFVDKNFNLTFLIY